MGYESAKTKRTMEQKLTSNERLHVNIKFYVKEIIKVKQTLYTYVHIHISNCSHMIILMLRKLLLCNKIDHALRYVLSGLA